MALNGARELLERVQLVVNTSVGGQLRHLRERVKAADAPISIRVCQIIVRILALQIIQYVLRQHTPAICTDLRLLNTCGKSQLLAQLRRALAALPASIILPLLIRLVLFAQFVVPSRAQKCLLALPQSLQIRHELAGLRRLLALEVGIHPDLLVLDALELTHWLRHHLLSLLELLLQLHRLRVLIVATALRHVIIICSLRHRKD